MELRHFRYFIAVAEERNFTRAAEACHVVQSTLSQQIERLEKELGTQLFARTSRTVRLTAAGEHLLPLARRALEAADSVTTEAHALSGLRTGTLRLGFIQSLACPVDTIAVLDDFHQAHPEIGLRILNAPSPSMVDAVVSGELDLAVVGLSPRQLPAELTHKRLGRDALVAVVNPDHELAGQESVTLRQLAEVPLVRFRQGTGLRRQVDEAFSRAEQRPRNSIEVFHLQDMLRMAARGFGATVVPRSAVTGALAPTLSNEPIRVLPITDRGAVHPLTAVYRHGELSASASAFLTTLLRHFSAQQDAE
ncbi:MULTISPECIES: LysR family transcriptional regulator [unclassified Streptomyces]|uniref:LysR family transcriptional regulator n=1 Tax=unclassified Streptomyces TaxID=2593676 RepID=UPI000DBAC7A0|nr:MULTISPECIES: LysR family transcriptional regulator [unclassified Streptomyces]MYT73471.1 LysR family transcriptional regulator [Streptomyces sp. SID8367]RAJ85003.1 DNA-binding transcriptional LysR family regulator [Streptomyces sp. PsTaAH-137]